MSRLVLIIIACLTLGACASKEAKTLTRKTCTNPAQCEIQILSPTCGMSGCTATVDFEYVGFKKNVNNFKVTWKLPDGFGFCDTAGDGVWLKQVDPHEQFEKPSADKPSGSGPCRFKEFQLRAKNTKSLPEEKDWYQYKIIFHDEAGRNTYIVDPFMMNE
ncbi:MAG TPA: hypothetical protein PKV98_05860 [Burkholderiaceae bacterium]|nr:hypothetical protein [Burkholderiaceae bacterium]